jgi:hypothetical protein
MARRQEEVGPALLDKLIDDHAAWIETELKTDRFSQKPIKSV